MSQPDVSPRDPVSAYLLRHWRGELPLPLSLWVNGALVWLAFFVAIALLRPRSFLDAEPLGWLRVVLIVLYYPIEIWQLVGLSRAALRYRRLGGAILWANLVQLVVILSCFRIFSGLVMGSFW